MTGTAQADDGMLSPPERQLVRFALLPRFGQSPPVADGIWLKIWKSGDRRGELKVPLAVQGMLDRGLVRLSEPGVLGGRAYFTPDGIESLKRTMAANPRFLEPKVFQHLYEELGVPLPPSG